MEEPDLLQLLKIICDVLAEHKVVELIMEFSGANCYENFYRPLLHADSLLHPQQCELIPEPKSTTILETRITLPDFCVNARMARTSTIRNFLEHVASFFTPENYACGNGGRGYLRIYVNKQELSINTVIYDSDERRTGSLVDEVFSADHIKPVSKKLGPNLKSIRKVRTDGGT